MLAKFALEEPELHVYEEQMTTAITGAQTFLPLVQPESLVAVPNVALRKQHNPLPLSP
jgi:hypothetical protein